MAAPHPELFFLELLKDAGVNPTDPTEVRCDICCDTDTASTKGGHVLLERANNPGNIMGQFTYECEQCYHQYTCATPEERKKCSGLRAVALRHKIGIDPQDVFHMDPTKAFKENVILFKKTVRMNGARADWKLRAEFQGATSGQNKTDTETDTESAGAAGQDFHRVCRKCKQPVPCADIKRCGRCHMAYYCTRECQRQDWKDHRSDCHLVEDAQVPI